MSTILSIDDLNDFISPGVACIKPVEIKKTKETAEIEIGRDGEAFEVTRDGEKQSLEAAQISLTDCLACSGCITSAESVLVSMQSHKEVLASVRAPESKDKIFVASVSHQVRVSLAAAYGIPIEEADLRIKHVLVNVLGFKYVVGLEVGRAIALEYGAKEVLDRKNSGSGPQTVLCSSCPGWTCYVEKTHPHVIPYLSNVKSPQQITGSILKRLVGEQHGVEKESIYHLSLMPCFDKKLEASRPEFEKEVDCVITTKEVVQLLLDEEMPFDGIEVASRAGLDDGELAPRQWPSFDQLSSWASNLGSSSGGYLDHVLGALSAAAGPTKTEIKVIQGRNTDTIDYLVVDAENPDKVLAKAARVYGFRNIQNLVRKLKQKRGGGGVVRRVRRTGQAVQAAEVAAQHSALAYDYVEVMACPGGCINGGGQIGRPDRVSDKEWRARAEQLYESMPLAEVTRAVVEAFVDKVQIPETSLVYTDFHAVEQATDPAAIAIGTKW